MNNQEKSKQHGGRRPNAGRKSHARELGLVDLMLEAWPIEERIKNIKHLASLITNETVNTPRGPRYRVDPKVQVLAAELLLKYAYGTPKAIEVQCTIDLSADVDAMTPEERAAYSAKLLQYAASKGIALV